MAVKLLEWHAPYRGLTPIPDALAILARAEAKDGTLDLSHHKEALAEMAKSEAYFAIAQAGNGPKMAKAEPLVEDGDALLAAGDYRGAVRSYRRVILVLR